MTFDEFFKSFTDEEATQIAKWAARYKWLRDRDPDTIECGGVFAGQTPENVILSGEDLDAAIDAAITVQ